jgi:putative phosphoesterase
MRPSALRALAGVELIVHAGDVGQPEVLAALYKIAPVVAVRGNVDTAPWARSLPATAEVPIGGVRLYVLHDLYTLDRDPRMDGLQAVIYGHSHRHAIEERGGVLFLNPGSAGPRRFQLPITLALLDIRAGALTARLVELEA